MPRSNDVILQTVARYVAFLIMIFSIYLFFAGHHSPGGGFIGGLMTSGALLLVAIAFGSSMLRQLLPFDFRMLTAAGLLVALLTGMGSFVFDVSFMTHAFGHITAPWLGEIELSTAVLFDLGVYLTVVGVTMTIILSIGEDR